jgi:anti-sigma factor RsiW
MNSHDENNLKDLLRQALPPVKDAATPERDLWPAMQQRMNAKAEQPAVLGFSGWALFDGVLLVGLAGLVALFPASIPLLLYYL